MLGIGCYVFVIKLCALWNLDHGLINFPCE